jgi:hypothetical protein
MKMKKYIIAGIFVALCSLLAAELWAEPAPESEERIPPVLKRVAVAPFLVGRREPAMDEILDQTVSCPISEICIDDPTIAADAGTNLTRLTDDYLRQHYDFKVVAQDDVTAAMAQLTLDGSRDSPRTLALKLGRLLNVDAVFVGTVWRYRDRGAIKEIPNSPASVAFAVYLIETEKGLQLWRGLYSVTQEPLLTNLFKAKKQLQLGLQWRTGEELAQIGVKEVFRKFLQ